MTLNQAELKKTVGISLITLNYFGLHDAQHIVQFLKSCSFVEKHFKESCL